MIFLFSPFDYHTNEEARQLSKKCFLLLLLIFDSKRVKFTCLVGGAFNQHTCVTLEVEEEEKRVTRLLRGRARTQ